MRAIDFQKVMIVAGSINPVNNRQNKIERLENALFKSSQVNVNGNWLVLKKTDNYVDDRILEASDSQKWNKEIETGNFLFLLQTFISCALFFSPSDWRQKKSFGQVTQFAYDYNIHPFQKSASVPLNYVYAADNAISSCSNDGSKNQTSVYMEYVRDNYHSFLLSLKSALTLINKLHAIR